MLKRLSLFTAAAAALVLAAAPAAQADGRRGYDGDHHYGYRYDHRDYGRYDHRDYGRYRYVHRRPVRRVVIVRPWHRPYYRPVYRRSPVVVVVPAYPPRYRYRPAYFPAPILQTVLETQPTGVATAWRDPDGVVTGQVTPTHTYQIADGQYCREYQQTVVIDGQTQQAYGRACRQPDGSWQTAD